MNLDYMIWNGGREIFSYGWLSLRWYGLLFAGGFVLSYIILSRIFRKEGKPVTDVDTLTVYMVLATVLGARLGHVLFYQREIITSDPLSVLLPFQFNPTFEFTGFQGLASHGGAFGILFALWLYTRYLITWSPKKGDDLPENFNDGNKAIKSKIKKGFNIIRRDKPGQSYIQILDRIVIVVTLTGAMIRLGNFFNSEIIGKPTDQPFGIVFAGDLREMFTNTPGTIVDYVSVKKNPDAPVGVEGRVPVHIYLVFKPGTAKADADHFMVQQAKMNLIRDREFFEEPMGQKLDYVLTEDKGDTVGMITTTAIARHPAQLYESISCFLFFILLYTLWAKGLADKYPGLIFGVFMIILWTLRFAYEFLKEPQVDFERTMTLNMGQILSIPLMIAGVLILIAALNGKFQKAWGK
ncbi:MAG: prolipoprotein diacylglyceryl transferase [Bacteroidota bacterium]